MSKTTTYQELLDAGVHFGHLTRKWNPRMAPYIFMERNGIHIIDLNKTLARLEEAAHAAKQIAKSGKKILFVATKKQAKSIVAEKAAAVNMPFITERWPGGMLTNFATIRKSIKKMGSLDRMATDGTYETISKKERLQIERQKAKMRKLLGSISDLTRLPVALFIVDTKKEHIAVAEAQKLNIPTFAIVDTNSDPTEVDFPVPANDDATKSIALIMEVICSAIEEGLSERKMDREMEREKETGEKEEAEETGTSAQAATSASADEEEEEEATGTEGGPAKKVSKRPRKKTTARKEKV